MISWIIWNGSKGAWNLQLEALKCLRGLKAAGYSQALPCLPMTNLAGFASIKPPFVSPWPQESLGKYTWALLKLQELIFGPQGRQSGHPAVKYGPTKSHHSHPTWSISWSCLFLGQSMEQKFTGLSLLAGLGISTAGFNCSWKTLLISISFSPLISQYRLWIKIVTGQKMVLHGDQCIYWEWLKFRMILEDKNSKYFLGVFSTNGFFLLFFSFIGCHWHEVIYQVRQTTLKRC